MDKVVFTGDLEFLNLGGLIQLIGKRQFRRSSYFKQVR